ncbi:hypothetical protein ACRALDRAFT_2020950 [Sodiomyces alcalophilus JCM 7366]|uniref:uncharacterized protein n=1 Tax=Sodiomyces alcalophilus JCM 7366 TaxID=591952 RepID=UPI0039B6C373
MTGDQRDLGADGEQRLFTHSYGPLVLTAPVSLEQPVRSVGQLDATAHRTAQSISTTMAAPRKPGSETPRVSSPVTDQTRLYPVSLSSKDERQRTRDVQYITWDPGCRYLHKQRPQSSLNTFQSRAPGSDPHTMGNPLSVLLFPLRMSTSSPLLLGTKTNDQHTGLLPGQGRVSQVRSIRNCFVTYNVHITGLPNPRMKILLLDDANRHETAAGSVVIIRFVFVPKPNGNFR